MSDQIFALCLGLGAAVTLAVANASIKASGDVFMARATMSLSASVIALPFIFVVPLPNFETWAVLAISIPAHALYQATLVKAMTRGDLSLVFPIMRGGAPLITTLFAYLALGETHTPLALVGLCIASLSIIAFALPDTKLAVKIDRSALIWALLCSSFIALYNVIDAKGVRVAPSAFTFIVWFFVLDCICINVAALWVRRSAILDGYKLHWRYGLTAALMSLISFGMTLYAFSFADVAVVSSLRETSVVIAALIGWRMLKEGSGFRRIIAAACLTIGLILFQFA